MCSSAPLCPASLFAVLQDNFIRVWNTEDGALTNKVAEHPHVVLCCAWDSTGKRALSSCAVCCSPSSHACA